MTDAHHVILTIENILNGPPYDREGLLRKTNEIEKLIQKYHKDPKHPEPMEWDSERNQNQWFHMIFSPKYTQNETMEFFREHCKKVEK